MSETLGSVVKQRRAALNFTQGEAARQARVTRSWLNAIEADGVTRPGYEKLERMERVLELPSGRLLRLAGYPVGIQVVPSFDDSLESKLRLIQRMTADALSLIQEQARLGSNGRSDGTEPGVRAHVATREREEQLAS
jgi:transcriptional regulator with XRE-family HTH domain